MTDRIAAQRRFFITEKAHHALRQPRRDAKAMAERFAREELPPLGRHAAGALRTSAEPSADCYRDYAKILAFESAGARAQAEQVRSRMLAQQRAALTDQWAAVGGRLYTTALTALAAR